MQTRKQHAPMPTQEQNKQSLDLDKQERQQRNAEIGKHVIHSLGQPANLYNVQVRPLWKDRYRVNVLVGPDITAVTCAHSYFLVTDSEGNIIASTPKITRVY
jgi:hypothetical protein